MYTLKIVILTFLALIAGYGSVSAASGTDSSPAEPNSNAPLGQPPITGRAFSIDMPVAGITPTSVAVGSTMNVGATVYYQSGQDSYTLTFSIGNDATNMVQVFQKTLTGTQGATGAGNTISWSFTRSATKTIDTGDGNLVDLTPVDLTKPVFGFINACIAERDTLMNNPMICKQDSYQILMP